MFVHTCVPSWSSYFTPTIRDEWRSNEPLLHSHEEQSVIFTLMERAVLYSSLPAKFAANLYFSVNLSLRLFADVQYSVLLSLSICRGHLFSSTYDLLSPVAITLEPYTSIVSMSDPSTGHRIFVIARHRNPPRIHAVAETFLINYHSLFFRDFSRQSRS